MAQLIVNVNKIKEMLKPMQGYQQVIDHCKILDCTYSTIGGSRLSLDDLVDDVILHIVDVAKTDKGVLENRTSEEVCTCVINLLMGYVALVKVTKSYETPADQLVKKRGTDLGYNSKGWYFCTNLYREIDSDHYPIVCATLETDQKINYVQEQTWIGVDITEELFHDLVRPQKMKCALCGTSPGVDRTILMEDYQDFLIRHFTPMIKNIK